MITWKKNKLLKRILKKHLLIQIQIQKEKMEMIPDYFDGQQSFLTFISKYAMASAND